MSKNPSVALILDRSGSMKNKPTGVKNTKLQLLQTDTNTFMTIMQNIGKDRGELGQLGIVEFETDVDTLFPLEQLDQDGDVVARAIQAVNGITTGDRTNIKGAIAAGQTMLAGVDKAAFNPGMVLFSDGMWNEGGNPTTGLTRDIPIFTVGYGDSSSLSYLETIAEKTGGISHITGDPGMLASIYYQLISETKTATVLANAHQEIGQYSYKSTQAVVSPGTETAVFAADWDDDSLAYTPTAPGPGEMAVILKDPSGQEVQPTSVNAPANAGYAVLTVSDPQDGVWTVTRWFSSAEGVSKVHTAAGAFAPRDSINTQVTALPVNSPLRALVRVTDDGEPLTDVEVRSAVKRPVYSHAELTDRFGEDLRRIRDQQDFHKEADPHFAALSALREKLLPKGDIFQHQFEPAMARPHEDGFLVQTADHKRGAPHHVFVKVTGYSPVTDRRFSRTEMVTVVP